MTSDTDASTKATQFCGRCSALARGTPYCEICGARLMTSPEDLGQYHGAAARPDSLGQESASISEVFVDTATPPFGIAAVRPSSSRRWWIAGGVAASVVIVFAAVGTFVALGKDSNQPSYTTQVVGLITPVLTDNDQLTRDIAALTPSSSISTVQSDVVMTQASTRTAQQLVASISAPPNDAVLASQLNVALTSESAWLQVVSSVLGNMSSPSLSHVSGLGLSAQFKFLELGATLKVVAHSKFPSSTQFVTIVSAKNTAGATMLATAQFSNQVMALLNQSTSTYQQANSLYQLLNKLANGEYTTTNLTIAQAEQDINGVIVNRNSLTATVQALMAPTPAAQIVQADMVKAFQDSLTNDSDLATCLNQNNTGTEVFTYQTCLSSTYGASVGARSDEQTFLFAYNLLRATLGQPAATFRF